MVDSCQVIRNDHPNYYAVTSGPLMKSRDHLAILTASHFAMMHHEGQVRKYTGDSYFNHLSEVAFLVATMEGTYEMICAAYLHDTLEDTKARLSDIVFDFGENVGKMVVDLTDTSKPSDGNRAARKLIDRERLSKASREAKSIKCADIISNLRSIKKHDPEFAKVYFAEKREDLAVLSDASIPMLYLLARETIYDYYNGVN